MTIDQILKHVRPLKRMSRPMIYLHLRNLNIKPLGIRQRPQRYPDNTPQRILKSLGFTPARHARNRNAA